jgi:hypothetical protein
MRSRRRIARTVVAIPLLAAPGAPGATQDVRPFTLRMKEGLEAVLEFGRRSN